MKYHIPDDYAAFAEHGFDNNNDIFGRKRVAESLTKIISDSDDSLVISLDAPWGEGKTAFLHMWQKTLNDQHIPVIYFDAFKNDHHQDPFPPLSSAIYELAKKNQLLGDGAVKAFEKGVGKLLKSGMGVGLKFLTRMAVYKLVGDTGFEGILDGVADDVSNEVMIGEKFLSAYTNQEATIEAFNQSLTGLSQHLLEAKKVNGTPSASKNIIFIIDELDRCRPDYALALIELIKHVFSAAGVCFVLSMNKSQLSESLKTIYGTGFDSVTYLDKFIHISTSLPKIKNRPRNLISYERYIIDTAEKIGLNLYEHDITTLAQYFNALNIPLRIINKSIINLGIYYSVDAYGLLRHSNISNITIGMCVFKTYKPEIFELLSNLYVSRTPITLSIFRGFLSDSVLVDEIGQDWLCIIRDDTRMPNIEHRASRATQWTTIDPDWSDTDKMLHDISQPLKYFVIP